MSSTKKRRKKAKKRRKKPDLKHTLAMRLRKGMLAYAADRGLSSSAFHMPRIEMQRVFWGHAVRVNFALDWAQRLGFIVMVKPEREALFDYERVWYAVVPDGMTPAETLAKANAILGIGNLREIAA